jgi:hypothetical protein
MDQNKLTAIEIRARIAFLKSVNNALCDSATMACARGDHATEQVCIETTDMHEIKQLEYFLSLLQEKEAQHD